MGPLGCSDLSLEVKNPQKHVLWIRIGAYFVVLSLNPTVMVI